MASYLNTSDLLNQVVETWKKQGYSPHDSGGDFYNLQNEPVVRLLVAAVAQQSRLIQDDVEHFQDSLLKEYLQISTPEALFRPAPAMGMLQVVKSARQGMTNDEPTIMGPTSAFTIGKRGAALAQQFNFLPVLETYVYNIAVHGVERMERERWLVRLEVREAMSSLKGLSLYLPTVTAQDEVRLSVGGRRLEVAGMDDFYKLPFVKPLRSAMRANEMGPRLDMLQRLYDVMTLTGGLYAVVLSDDELPGGAIVDGCLELELELPGVGEAFVLPVQEVMVNCVPVMNVSLHSDVLTRDRPLLPLDLKGEAFLSVVPSADGAMSDSVEVRSVGTMRMSPRQWQDRMHTLLDYYDSEYSILRPSLDARTDALISQLTAAIREAAHGGEKSAEGIFLVLTDRNTASAGATWMSTLGEAANGLDETSAIVAASPEVDTDRTRLVGTTRGGRPALTDVDARQRTMRYYQQTRDRVVSRSDIMAFCSNRLTDMFGILPADIAGISLSPLVATTSDGLYERVALVTVSLTVMPADADRVARSLQRMLRARSVSAMPLQVTVVSPNRHE